MSNVTASADKRSVTTDALETLGMIHFKPEGRDAIHLAVEPVVAGHALYPNDDIELVDGVAWRAKRNDGAIGKVDPFLPGPVEKGQRFWLVIYPRMITSLRHVWEHPAFPKLSSES